MFNYYSNLISFLLLFNYPKPQNDHNYDVKHKSDVLITTYKSFDSNNKCLDSLRIERFVHNSVQSLIQKLQTISDNSTQLEVNIQSTINVRHLNVLRQYLPQNYDHLNCEQLEEFEDSINEFIQSLVTVSDIDTKESLNTFSFTQQIMSSDINFRPFLYLLIILAAFLTLKQLFGILFRRQTLSTKKSIIILITILLFLTSIVWKWRQKYLIELSRKQCYVLAAPEECLNRNSEVTFVSWMRHYWYSYEQRRHDYYRAVTVDPFWEINPLSVITELFSEQLFTPLKPLGEYSGLFMASFFSKIPLYLVVPVFIFLCFCAVLIALLFAVWLLMPNRYSIKIPFLMTIQFDRNPGQQLADQQRTGITTGEQSVVRKYEIRASVVNVYHTIGSNNSNSVDNNFTENQIKFDENLRFETIKPISIPYSEVD